ncbi:hypothetical protein GF325_09965 [Candidatus Bathyarchaeota archaeon]|nr:hypothetical protein [Candidatus Bathyarchaeota archaeon]
MSNLGLFVNPGAPWALHFYLAMGFHVKERDRDRILAMHGGAFTPYHERGTWLLWKCLEVS